MPLVFVCSMLGVYTPFRSLGSYFCPPVLAVII